jgi:hypothetical protein
VRKPILVRLYLVYSCILDQHYHVIVEAKPLKHYKHDNYWIRTIPARQCSSFSCGPDEKIGILRCNTTTDPVGMEADPLSEPLLFDIACADEPYKNLVPYLPWCWYHRVILHAVEGMVTCCIC